MKKKPWYQSKIFVLSVVAVLTIGGNYLTGWFTGQGVTQEQIDAVAAVQPAVAQAIEKYQHGAGLLESLSMLAFAFIGVWRKWFTSSLI